MTLIIPGVKSILPKAIALHNDNWLSRLSNWFCRRPLNNDSHNPKCQINIVKDHWTMTVIILAVKSILSKTIEQWQSYSWLSNQYCQRPLHNDSHNSGCQINIVKDHCTMTVIILVVKSVLSKTFGQWQSYSWLSNQYCQRPLDNDSHNPGCQIDIVVDHWTMTIIIPGIKSILSLRGNI